MKFEEITELEFQTFKQAACELAHLDGKEPLAITNQGHEEWRNYVSEVRRHVVILNGLANGPKARVSVTTESVLG